MNYLPGRAPLQQGLIVFTQRFGRQKGSVYVEVFIEGPVDRAGDVACDRVERLELATEAAIGACIEDQCVTRLRCVQHFVDQCDLAGFG